MKVTSSMQRARWRVRAVHLSSSATVAAALLAGDLHAQRWAQHDGLPARRRAGTAFDPVRQRVVLHGGIDTRGTVYAPAPGGASQTWELDSDVWTMREDFTGPYDSSKAMVLDPLNQRVLLVAYNPVTFVAETRVWRGNFWQPVTTANRPTYRQHFATAFDERRGRLVLWGGSTIGTGQTDVWEFDGSNWTQIVAAGPTARDEPALAFDGVRGTVVLFGGRAVASGQALSDTWEWNGTAWTQLNPSPRPPARGGHSLTWDPARRRVVLFGGGTATPGLVYGDTWEWSGSTWTQVNASIAPPARTAHASTFVPGRNRVLITCGETPDGLLADTWEFDGTFWTQVVPAAQPPARSNHAVAYDAARQNLILFGGRDGTTVFTDTWSFRGRQWTRLSPVVTVTERYDHAMTYDSARSRVVLFGGLSGRGPQNDTWLWDGTTWMQARPALSPPARSQHAMAFDSARGRVVLFGGTSTPGNVFGDTWEWDGTNWQQITPAAAPSPRAEHAMAFDAARGQIVLLSGHDGTSYLQDTWTFDGTTWTQRATTLPDSSAHAGCGMDYDPVRQRVYAFAGWSGNSSFATRLLFAWDGSSWSQLAVFSFPQPGARANTNLTWDARAQHMLSLGGRGISGSLPETWFLTYNDVARLVRLAPQANCFGASLPELRGFGAPVLGNPAYALDFEHDNSPYPAAPVTFLLSSNQAATGVVYRGCQLTVDPATLFSSTTVLRSGSFASLPLPIPLATYLSGLQFTAQCLTLDPTSVALGGLALSGGARVTIGDY